MITIIDYGMGNLGSIQNMFKRIGVKSVISQDPEEISKAQKILLPGVGSFDNAMVKINRKGIRGVLDRKVLLEGIPILGICLGMQLLTRESEEGDLPGLGWIPASTKRFPAIPGLKIPHMGWNFVEPASQSTLTKDLPKQSRFYFIHSFYVSVDDERDSILKSTHGITFDAAIQHKNIFGVQFHPEKSHKFGQKIFENFAKL